MSVRRIYVEKRPGGAYDIPAQQLAADLRELFALPPDTRLRLINRYDLEGMSDDEYAATRDVVFSEPPVDVVYDEALPGELGAAALIAIEPLPGQYDQRADSAAQCVQLVTGRDRPTIRTARVIALIGDVDAPALAKAYLINPVESREASLDKPATLADEYATPPDVEVLAEFNGYDDAALRDFLRARGLAMSFADLAFCQKYFRDTEQRPPTLTEIRVIDTYWSDHCRHTTFTTALDRVDVAEGGCAPAIRDALARYRADRKTLGISKPESLMDLATIGAKMLRRNGKLADLDVSDEINACSIVVPTEDGNWLVMFKNETHNHPTEIEPFGGAATCLGGAIRDPLSGRAYVYQAMRLTGAADPRRPLSETLPGKLPQRKIVRAAAHGYSSYGNQIGLATGQVAEMYHPGYVAKRMEIGAVIAATPQANVVRAAPVPGDVVILVGGRTGRDGMGGATGSSKEHTADSLLTCGAEVQKGNPPTERKIQRLFRAAGVSRLIKRCNDFGAGGVAVAVGELTDGLDIDLDAVPKKYDGLDGTELAISESQERMAVVVAARDVDAFVAAADRENLEATPIAVVTDRGRLVMRWRGKVIVDLSRGFLDTNGVQQHATAIIASPAPPPPPRHDAITADRWLDNLRDLNVCSQKGLGEQFDSTIGAASLLMPFGGKHQLTPQEGMVATLPMLTRHTNVATAMTFGLDPALMEWSPFHGAAFAVVAAVAKLVALGADATAARLSLQEYFESLGTDPQRWGKPLAALLGALTAQRELGVPAIGGKDSMSGTFMDIHVPPTLAAFAVAALPADKVVSAEFKRAGSELWLVPAPLAESGLPDWERLRRNFALVHRLVGEGAILAAATVGVGGLAATVSKMALGNRLGLVLDAHGLDLFAATCGALALEVAHGADVSALLAGGARRLGLTTPAPALVVNGLSLPLTEVERAYREPLEKIFPTTTGDSGEVAVACPSPRRCLHAKAHLAKPRVLIPVFPGTNCEYDTARQFEQAGALVDTLIVRNLTASAVAETVDALDAALHRAHILMLPGGFSGGDEPDGSGKFIAAMFRHPRLAEAVRDLLTRDGLILGICNGFQALLKLGLLPCGDIRDLTPQSPTLTFNTIGRHVSRMVYTRVASTLSPWLAGVEVGDVHTVPVSHGEGRFVADADVLAALNARGQIATQYVDPDGNPAMSSDWNPNGSLWAIEGITDPSGRIFGKMGHSERLGPHVAQNVPGDKDQRLFRSGVRYFD